MIKPRCIAFDFDRTLAHFNDGNASIIHECNKWMSHSIVLYNGAMEFMDIYKSRIPISIVTFGDEEFQKEKIYLVGLGDYDIHITEALGQKASVIKKLGEKHGYPILFVDDKPSELDVVLEELGSEKVITAFFDRPDLRGDANEMEKKHVRLKTFEDIEKMLQKE